MFSANGYPRIFFSRILDKFNLSQERSDISELTNEIEKSDRKYIFGVPWVGNASRDYKKKVINLFKQHFDIDIFCYYTSCKVSSFFTLKSTTPHALRARIVYKFTCLKDSDTYYIGKSKRHLITRAMEHITPL